MAQCECLPKCPFFHDKMEDMPAMADIYKRKYCQGDNSECARYSVFTQMGPGSPPMDLYPNNREQAEVFLAANGFVTA
jgi:hypothetical protein